MRVCKKVEVAINGGRASFSPPSDDVAAYAARIDFPHAAVRRTGGSFRHALRAVGYEEEISRARTFCYVSEVETMRRHRRALGGSLRCAVVYDDSGVLNPEGLRYPDEFVRHKVLDAVGDCYINGHFDFGGLRRRLPRPRPQPRPCPKTHGRFFRMAMGFFFAETFRLTCFALFVLHSPFCDNEGGC